MKPIDNEPLALTEDEWSEILGMKDVQESWGYEPDEDLHELQARIYAVRFDFVSGSPGYCGPLYLLLGDALTPPLSIIRDTDGRLIAVAV